MKKFFSFVAVALVAFSFASCKGDQNDPSVTGFKITVSDVKASSAKVKIEPVDTTATYIFTYVDAAVIAKLSDDSIKVMLKAALDYTIEYYKEEGESTTYADFLYQGVAEEVFESLQPKSEYVIVAVKMDAQAVFSGVVAKKAFTTPDVEVKKTVDLGALDDDGFEDWRSYDGSFCIYAVKGADTEVCLTIFSEGFAGNFTEKDMDLDYSYVWTKETGKLNILRAELVGKENAAAKSASIEGWVIGSDEVKYTLSVVYSTEEPAGAPKRIAIKKALPAKGLKKF